ncbi:MAG: hypothetical protein J6V81_01210 [Bacteroidales bacterium]|nr:hypothetical protein [Bacteroidales bacterium]
MKTPAWTRLDNASIIYPSCRTRKYATIFRLTVTLDEEVSEPLLGDALRNCMKRFPGFRYTLDKGFFWWFLRRLENDPVTAPPFAMRPFNFRKNGGYLFKAGCDGRCIVLDFFHALTDGTGAMTFLMSLTAEYIRLRYGAAVPAGKWVLDLEEEPLKEEMEDSFDRFSGTKGSLDKETRAYHLHGTEEPAGVLNNIKISLPLDKMQDLAKANGCTLTELVTAVMLLSLQDVRSRRPVIGDSPFLKVEVPVNLRPMFGSRTLRNFSSYVHLGIDVRNGALPFEDILQEVKLQKRLYVNPHRLTTRVAANVALEDNLAIRSIPLFIKKMAINFINSHKGENYCSQTLSNLGEISLPDEMRRHVCDIDFILGRPMKKSGACTCVSYGNHLNLNFSRKIAERGFEDAFIRNLENMGITAQTEASTPSEKNRAVTKAYSIPMRWAKVGMLRTLLLI